MSKMEKEVKVLDVDVEATVDKITRLGGVIKEDSVQKIYTYDLGTIVGRYNDLLIQLSKGDFELMKAKFKLLFFEVDNLMNADAKQILIETYGLASLVEILNNTTNIENLNALVKEPIIERVVSKFDINPNKWVRLRQSDDLTTITVKNILESSDDKLQSVLETEMTVPSIEEANALLEQLGFVFRNYQEKRRITYNLLGAEVDIDFWPMIPPYMEIEGESLEQIEDILKKLNLGSKEVTSCNTAEIYRKYNMNIYDYRELRLDEKNKCKKNMLEHNRKMQSHV